MAKIGNLRVAIASGTLEWRVEGAVGCAGSAFAGRS